MAMLPTLRMSRRRGQAAVEMALIFPALLLILMGIMEFSRAFFIRTVLTNAAREGARYGILHPTWVSKSNKADPDNITARSKRFVTGLNQSKLNVAVDFPDGTQKTGDRLRVSLSYGFRLMLPIRVKAIVLRGSSTMRIEQTAT